MAGNNPFEKNGGGTATKTRSRGLAAANGDSEPTSVKPRDPFAVPSGGGGDYKFTEFVGELLLVRPTEVEVRATSVDPNTECVHVDVIRLDNENEQVDDMLVFGSALIRTFKAVMRGDNDWVLGRLEMGEAKKGRNAPYILTTPTEDDVTQAKSAMSDLGLL